MSEDQMDPVPAGEYEPEDCLPSLTLETKEQEGFLFFLFWNTHVTSMARDGFKNACPCLEQARKGMADLKRCSLPM